jgi:hypothetical protein
LKLKAFIMKKNEKNDVLELNKRIFFTALFWLVPWLCIAKMICTA